MYKIFTYCPVNSLHNYCLRERVFEEISLRIITPTTICILQDRFPVYLFKTLKLRLNYVISISSASHINSYYIVCNTYETPRPFGIRYTADSVVRLIFYDGGGAHVLDSRKSHGIPENGGYSYRKRVHVANLDHTSIPV